MDLRPLQHIKEYSCKYPDCWKMLDYFRNSKGQDKNIDWPDWCFLPIAATYAVVSSFYKDDPLWNLKHGMDIGIVNALYTWRISQGIYRFDSAFFDSLASTPIEKIPCDILYRLPEWGIYIECNGNLHYPGEDDTVYGYYVHLEHDMNDHRTEVRFVFDTEMGLYTFPMHLKDTIEDSIIACYQESEKYTPLKVPVDDYILGVHKRIISKAIAPLLYLCSENQDISRNGNIEFSTGKPIPKKTKNGLRYFPPDKPAFFEVGFKVGNTLRSLTDSCESISHAGPRPHIRRAHWHTFLSGKRNTERMRSLKWLPPILVNFEDSEIVPTIKNVV